MNNIIPEDQKDNTSYLEKLYKSFILADEVFYKTDVANTFFYKCVLAVGEECWSSRLYFQVASDNDETKITKLWVEKGQIKVEC